MVLVMLAGTVPGDEKPAAPRIYAYADLYSGTVHLVRDGTAVDSMPGDYPAFTSTGRFLVTSTREKIFAMDVTTGAVHERALTFLAPAGCQVSRSLVGDEVMLVAPTLRRFRLPDLTEAGPVAAALPARLPGCVLGEAGGDVIVLVSNRSGRQIHRVDADGTTRQVGPEPLTPPGSHSAPADILLTVAAGARLAYLEDNAAVVHVLDLETGVDTVPSTAALGGPGPAVEMFVEDMWWSSAGVLHAMIQTEELGEEYRLCRVAGGAWEPVPTGDWEYVRDRPGGGRLFVERSRPYGLYEDGPGGTRLIAESVSGIVTPPPSGPFAQ
ncbi:hypothetical protein ACTI_50530 [Actinoplanes sp. OR16]|nr:hypothetical protein ACTI_50530 [Actinoplanes sp. OR16]